jgi:hypothetical protein
VHGRYSHLGALDWSESDFYAAFGRSVDQFIIDTLESRLKFIRKLSAKKHGLSDSEISILEKEGALSPNPDRVSPKNYQIVRSLDDPKARWVDGTPENTFYIYSLSLLFPGARFIHLLRDPNEVALSLMHFSRAGGAGIDYNESKAYSEWLRYVNYAVKGERALGKEKVLRVHYSELIKYPEKTLKDCLDFLGEDFLSNCLLPLQERINSSKVTKGNYSHNLKARQSKKANEYYNAILIRPPGTPDENALEELKRSFQAYAAHINEK